MSTSTATAISSASAMTGRIIPNGLSRIRYEVTGYFRQSDSVFFTFLFPVVMLTIFSVAFSEQSFGVDAAGDDVSAATFFLPGMLAAGVLLSGLQNMSIDIAVEKGDGTLKRLAGTPLSPISFFIGKIGQVLVTGILQAALLLLVARFAFGVDLPTEPAAWGTFAWVFLLGVDDLRHPGHRAQRPAAVRQERDRGHHPDRADPAVHLGRVPDVHEPARVAAERGEHLPAEVAGAGHALGVPPLDVRVARDGRRLEPRRRRDRHRHLAGGRPDRRPPDIPVDPQG